jgi:4-diphosphocytidyl-2-C-methyl-D-erythritol kinase
MIKESVSVWPAPAKLNLFLHITGRRQDGYHELQTLFQLLDWGDEVEIENLPDGDVSRTHDIEGIPEENDLSIRAGRLLKSETGCTNGARITLTKDIPTGAGLGGGSSDAATVLVALNQLWGCGLSVAKLSELGLQLGADVPLFINGKSAWAEGIGERIQSFELEPAWYVLVFPGIFVSTEQVFGSPDLKRDSQAITPADYQYSRTRNDCEKVVLEQLPVLAEIMSELQQWGDPRLTGTGSCIFIPVNEKNEANRITTELKSLYNVRAVRGVKSSPLLAKLPAGS